MNKSDLAAPLGVSVPTIGEWLSILEITGQILIVPPYFENFGKRLIKSPKIYWVDSGLLCHLLGIESAMALERAPFFGAVFETFVASEIVKHQAARGRSEEIYFFRDEQGLEVDFLVPLGGRKIALLEVKGGATAIPQMTKALLRLSDSIPATFDVKRYVVYRPLSSQKIVTIGPAVRALGLSDLIGEILPLR